MAAHPSVSDRRDLRVDFFRGLALLFIFVDHVPGNALAKATLTNFGFADAAEVFVLLAGYASFLAYGRAFEQGWFHGVTKVGLRIRDLYVSHVLLLIVCVGGLAIAARHYSEPRLFRAHQPDPFNLDPAGAISRASVLLYQPGYLNILPLYIVLLLWLPVLIALMRIHGLLALSASALLWAACGLFGLNLPNFPGSYGWVFNPFAWQLLFTVGALAGSCAMTRGTLRPSSRWLFWIAVAYVSFAFAVAAPWAHLPGLHDARLLPDFRIDLSKQYLSIWRLVHIVALGYIAGFLYSAARQMAFPPVGAARHLLRAAFTSDL